jgi:hypothetical protein
MKRLYASLALACLLPLSACARSETLIDMQVVDLDQGYTLNRIPYSGRDYIEGQPGHRFAVSLQNLTGERVMAVLSVDGVNAISGQTAGSSQSGYVLEPYQQVQINGWRKSYSDVAEFYFTDLPDSYAARTGRPQNVGVIGLAAFRERRPQPILYQPTYPTPVPQPRYEPYGSAEKSASDAAAESRAASPSAPAASSGMQADRDYGQSNSELARTQQLGTGHGQRRYDPVTQTQFERLSSRPNQMIALYYDSYDALVSRGVIRDRTYRNHYGQPDPFPIGFAPDPN